jgi:hypothetical protein
MDTADENRSLGSLFKHFFIIKTNDSGILSPCLFIVGNSKSSCNIALYICLHVIS